MHPRQTGRSKAIIGGLALLAIAGAWAYFVVAARDISIAHATHLIIADADLNQHTAGKIRRAAWSISAHDSNPDRAAAARAFDEALLNRQMNPHRAWNWSLADLFEARARAGLVADTTLIRYAHQSTTRPTFASAQEPVPTTDAWPTHMALWATTSLTPNTPIARGAPVSALRQRLMLTRMTIGTQTLPDHVVVLAPHGSPEPDANPHAQPIIDHAGVITLAQSPGLGEQPWRCIIKREVFWDPDNTLANEQIAAQAAGGGPTAASSVGVSLSTQPQNQPARTTQLPTPAKLLFADEWPVETKIRFVDGAGNAAGAGGSNTSR